jgi:hypothetical protein
MAFQRRGSPNLLRRFIYVGDLCCHLKREDRRAPVEQPRLPLTLFSRRLNAILDTCYKNIGLKKLASRDVADQPAGRRMWPRHAIAPRQPNTTGRP